MHSLNLNNTADEAALSGNLNVLAESHSNGELEIPVNSNWNIAHEAAESDHPKILQWIYSDDQLKPLINGKTIAHTAAKNANTYTPSVDDRPLR